MFEQSRILLEQYYCLMLTKGMSRRAEHMLHEVRGRLRALQWLHHRLVDLDRRLEQEQRKQQPPGTPVPNVMKLVFTDAARPDCQTYRHAALPFALSDELRVLLEAFYYSAHRVRDIFRDSANELPGLSNFEAVGVRNVRNHLVEHPGGKSGVLVFSFAAGGPVGPQLKPVRWSLDSPGTHDEGLHKNAAEFDKSLNRILERGIEALAASNKGMQPTR